MVSNEWRLRLSFSVDSQNFIFLRVENTPILVHCDWQHRGYELVCDCAAPSQLFFLEESHLTGIVGAQCVRDFPAGQAMAMGGKIARGLTSLPREVLSSELSILRFGRPRAFPRAAIEWVCDNHWDPLAQEVALFGLEEKVAANVKAIHGALSPEYRREHPWSLLGGTRRAERYYRKNLDETVAAQALYFTAP